MFYLCSWETTGEKFSGKSAKHRVHLVSPWVSKVFMQRRQCTWSQGRQTGSWASSRQMGHG